MVDERSTENYFLLAVGEVDDLPGLSVVMDPLPNGRVLLLAPFERLVMVPEPNFRVVPVTDWPPLYRSFTMELLPKWRVSVTVPFDQRVIVPEPNF